MWMELCGGGVYSTVDAWLISRVAFMYCQISLREC